MHSLVQFTAPPSTCAYLSDRVWRLGYEIVGKSTVSRTDFLAQAGMVRLRGFFRPKCLCTKGMPIASSSRRKLPPESKPAASLEGKPRHSGNRRRAKRFRREVGSVRPLSRLPSRPQRLAGTCAEGTKQLHRIIRGQSVPNAGMALLSRRSTHRRGLVGNLSLGRCRRSTSTTTPRNGIVRWEHLMCFRSSTMPYSAGFRTFISDISFRLPQPDMGNFRP